MNDRPNGEAKRFLIFEENVLLSLSKSSKTNDMDQIYTSPNHEDWVRWSFLRAL